MLAPNSSSWWKFLHWQFCHWFFRKLKIFQNFLFYFSLVILKKKVDVRILEWGTTWKFCFFLFSLNSLFSIIIFFLNDVSAMILPKNETGRVPAVFVYGDSIVDTGTNKYINTILKCNLNFPRYGSDFKGRKPTGSRKV